jgi:hypothetical protein
LEQVLFLLEVVMLKKKDPDTKDGSSGSGTLLYGDYSVRARFVNLGMMFIGQIHLLKLGPTTYLIDFYFQIITKWPPNGYRSAVVNISFGGLPQ